MSLFQMIQALPARIYPPIPIEDDPDRYSACVNTYLQPFHRMLNEGKYGPPSSWQAQQHFEGIVRDTNFHCAKVHLRGSIQLAKQNILPKTNFMEWFSRGVNYTCDVPSDHPAVLSLAILLANVPNTFQATHDHGLTWMMHSEANNLTRFIHEYCK